MLFRSIIVADIADWDWSLSNNGEGYPANQCMEGQAQVTDIVDDVRIYVDIGFIDGQGNVLGQAGPCTVRLPSRHTILGRMEFDEADLVELENAGRLEDVILHEMGHVLGVGTIWKARDLLKNPSIPGNQGADTHFNGPNAIAAFDNVGGAAYQGAKVPVANDSVPGQDDAHWRESVLDSELMTPFIEGSGPNQLSEVTVMSMKDLGYGIDPDSFDNYVLPFSQQQRVQGAPAPTTTPSFFDLSRDIHPGPVHYVDKFGRLREILR